MAEDHQAGPSWSPIRDDPANYDWNHDFGKRTLRVINTTPENGRLPESTTDSSATTLETAYNTQVSDIRDSIDRQRQNMSDQIRRNMRQTSNESGPAPVVDGESTHDTIMRLSNHFFPVTQPDADTLVYVGCPPQTRDQTDWEYENVKNQFMLPHLMQSEVLRSLGSSKFSHLLGPVSKRTQRKLQKLGIHKLVRDLDKIKYFINLSPDIHDDEGMILLTELSVPAGARSWHKKAQRFNISSEHVCGRDALNIPLKPIYRPLSISNNDGDMDAQAEQEESSEKQEDADGEIKAKTSQFEQKCREYDLVAEDDYSQLRHHTGIVRLLHAIAGFDPKLNSAAKVWTFCMLAKFFDCAHVDNVNRWVTEWIVQSQNLNFIQFNPSTSYRMGMAIQATWLVKCSFSIMVGQKAFSDTVSDVKEPSNMQWMRPSEITDGLDDDDLNRIDHAASNLVRRVKTFFSNLISDNGEWGNCRRPGSELAALYDLKFEDATKQQLLDEAKANLKDYVRRLLCAPLADKRCPAAEPRSMSRLPKESGVERIVPSLLRLLTSNFWTSLGNEEFSLDYASNQWLVWDKDLALFMSEGIMTADEADIPYISKAVLSESIDRVNASHFQPNYHHDDILASPAKKIKYSPPVRKSVEQDIIKTVWEEDPFLPDQIKSEPLHHRDEVLSAKESGTDQELHWEMDLETGVVKSEESDEDEWENVAPWPKPLTQPANGREKISNQLIGSQPLPFRNKPNLDPFAFDGDAVIAPDTTSSMQPIATAKRETVFEQAYKSSFDDFSDDESLTSPQKRVRDFIEREHRASIGKDFDHVSSSSPAKPIPSLKTVANGPFKDYTRPKVPAFKNSDYHSESQDSELPSDFNITIPPKPDIKAKRSSLLHPPTGTETDPTALGELFAKIDERKEQQQRQYQQYPQHQPLPLRNDPFQERSQNKLQPEEIPQTNTFTRAAFFDPEPLTTPKKPKPYNVHFLDRTDSTPLMYTAMLSEIHIHISKVIKRFLVPGFEADGSCAFDVPTGSLETLLNLTEDEYKYLPLWAGGFDDGSGGVFDDGDEIPEAPAVEEGGFRGGAMGIIPGVGSSIGGSMAGSEFEDIATDVGVSTVGKASRLATDGEDTVISMDED